VTLATVTRATRKHERASSEYRAALLAAHEAGHSYAEIAKAAGVSRQAVRQLLLRR
jgi:DNA-directed RNA polymerase specialized sigma24 family protein